MKTNPFATTCITIMCIMSILGSAVAQTVTVGVSPGDTFTYSHVVLWDSTDQTATIPAEYLDLNQTQSIQITIISVSGSLINMDITKNYRNGTESTENGNTDVDKQTSDIPYSFLIIRANANPNEKIYPSGGHVTFSETAFKTYPVGQIETINYVSEEGSGNDYEKTEIFFDRAIGAAAEYRYELRETSGSYVTTAKETLILERSNLGGNTDFPLYTVLIIIVVASLSLLLLATKLHKRHPQQQNKSTFQILARSGKQNWGCTGVCA